MSRARLTSNVSWKGFTLIEVLVVITLIALLATGATFAIGAVTRAKLRSSSMHVAAAARFAYGRAVVRGRTVRLALDLDGGTLAIEEAEGRVTLARPSDDEDEEGGEAIDPWAAARARIEGTFETHAARSPFGPVRGADDEPMARYSAQE